MEKKMNEDHFILDGYNIIHALREFSKKNHDFSDERSKLIDIMLEYGAYEGYKITIVFDALFTETKEYQEKINENICVVFTGAGKTADSYIEQLVYDEIQKNKTVYVVTSDKDEQMTVLGAGAYRLSTREFLKRVRVFKRKLRAKEKALNLELKGKTRLYECLSEETSYKLETLRRGEKYRKKRGNT